MKLIVCFLLALVAGAVLPFQAAVNGQLKVALGNPLFAAFVSFSVGTGFVLALLLMTRASLPTNVGAIPWWQWLLGGLLGASYLVLVIVLTPLLGVALSFSLIVAGQMLMAMVLDHYGLLGIPLHPVNAPRVAGAALLVAGVVLIRRY
jgi:transporter family-2 protein